MFDTTFVRSAVDVQRIGPHAAFGGCRGKFYTINSFVTRATTHSARCGAASQSARAGAPRARAPLAGAPLAAAPRAGARAGA
ncbi:unnamed protein product, partial [Iphiclides podalirius]